MSKRKLKYMAGRPTELDELKPKIRELMLEGFEDAEVCKELNIPEGTFKDWKYRDFRSFAVFYRTTIHERLLNQAEKVLGKSLLSEDDKISQDTAKYISSTLGKKHFSTRTESDITSAGRPLIPILGAKTNESIPSDNSNPQITETSQED